MAYLLLPVRITRAGDCSYSQLEKRFYKACKSAGLTRSIRLHEYQRHGWTFHGKGLWLTPVGDQRAVKPRHLGADQPARGADTSGAAGVAPSREGDWGIEPVTSTPILTMVGSPNFGRRSVERDLEAQVTVVTTDPVLRAALGQERDALFAHAAQVDDSVWQRPERQLGGWSWNAGAWIHLGHRIVARFL